MKLHASGRKIILLTWGAAQVAILSGCSIDIAPSNASDNIGESKKDGFFACEYVIDSLQLTDKNKSFVIKSAWAENRHSIITNAWGKETRDIDDSLYQIVFDIAGNSYYNNNNNNRWLTVDENGELDSWEGGLLVMDGGIKSSLSRKKFKIYWQKNEMDFKHDTTKVCEFILKKKP